MMAVLSVVQAVAFKGVAANDAYRPIPNRCLVVGLEPGGGDIQRARYAGVRRVTFSDLGKVALGPTGPDTVLAPLFSDDFDALDLLDRLCALQFHGTVQILAPSLPNRQIVLHELQSAAGKRGIRVELLTLS